MAIKKNFFLVLFFLPILFIYGVLVGQYEIFPFSIVRNTKRIFVPEKSIDRNNQNLSSLKEIDAENIYMPKIFLTYGQSNSANHGQIGYEVTKDIFMFYGGKIYEYKDPTIGATGNSGSVWGRVGDKLVEQGLSESIIFASSGVGGSSIKKLTYGKNFDFFISQVKSLQNKFHRIDGILFHQGESNHFLNKGSKNYKKDFESFLINLRKYTKAPIYLSQASICDSRTDPKLINIQNELIKKHKLLLRGPNSDLINSPKDRLPDNCHFSEEGYELLSDLWVESIKLNSED